MMSEGVHRTHRVQPQETTLEIVALNLFGNPSAAKAIYKANVDTIDNPNRIYPGQILVIPRLAHFPG